MDSGFSGAGKDEAKQKRSGKENAAAASAAEASTNDTRGIQRDLEAARARYLELEKQLYGAAAASSPAVVTRGATTAAMTTPSPAINKTKKATVGAVTRSGAIAKAKRAAPACDHNASNHHHVTSLLPSRSMNGNPKNAVLHCNCQCSYCQEYSVTQVSWTA
jgi:hypothetical protein